MSPGAREIRSGQAKGESSWRQKMRLLLASAPFFTTFPCCLLSAGIYLGGGGYAKDGGKRGAPCELSLRAIGKDIQSCWACELWTVLWEEPEGSVWRKRKKRQDYGRSPWSHRDALRIPKAAGLKSTSPLKYSIWPFVVLAQQLENCRQMSQMLLHDEHESLHPTQPPYIWPQEALVDCSHPPHTYDVQAGKGVAQRVGGGVTRSKLLRQH